MFEILFYKHYLMHLSIKKVLLLATVTINYQFKPSLTKKSHQRVLNRRNQQDFLWKSNEACSYAYTRLWPITRLVEHFLLLPNNQIMKCFWLDSEHFYMSCRLRRRSTFCHAFATTLLHTRDDRRIQKEHQFYWGGGLRGRYRQDRCIPKRFPVCRRGHMFSCLQTGTHATLLWLHRTQAL